MKQEKYIKGCEKMFYSKTGIKMKCGDSIRIYFPSSIQDYIKLCPKCQSLKELGDK